MKCAVIKKSYLCNAAVRRLPERFKQRQKHDNTVSHLHQENLMWESISPLRKSGSFAEIMFCWNASFLNMQNPISPKSYDVHFYFLIMMALDMIKELFGP